MPVDMTLLSDMYQIYSRMQGGFSDTPSYIKDNLKFPLRQYQEEAIGRYFYYIDNDKTVDRSRNVQLLFNMATGSGKTLVMASLLLDLYKRGYNKVIFFVNTTNIVEKTRDNFLNSSSSKYLYDDKIVIDGKSVQVREVSDFSDIREDAINIVFTTTAGLHSSLKDPRENSVTYDDLAGHDIVMLSDEAHHLNSTTKSKDDESDNFTWEKTVSTIMSNNPRNILLEFTATIDLDDSEILHKYRDRIIYRYDLRAFREDGFSKDVWIYDVAADLMDRSIQALIVSQYRKKVALEYGVWLKPVIMFKSFRINDSNDFFDEFVLKIKNLSADDLSMQKDSAAGVLKQAFDYYADKNISFDDLADELRIDFEEERLLSVCKKTVSPEDQQKLNSLEDRDNEIRAIFAVDVLDEGWDVLNLFDIVRLYDKRDSRNGKAGKTTMREAQLIGRGARYFPFVLNGEEDKRFVRKFDHNENHPLRAIEQIHYHSAHNPKYIQEIRQTLQETGIIATNTVEREIRLKEAFKNTRTYKLGLIWKNKQIPLVANVNQSSLFSDGYRVPQVYEIDLPVGLSKDTLVFGTDDSSRDNVETYSFSVKLNKFPKSLLRHAVDRNKQFRYDLVAKKIFGIHSMEGFVTGEKQLGGVTAQITAPVDSADKLYADQKLYIVEQILQHVASDLQLTEQSYRGSEEFEPVKLSDIFTDVKRNYTLIDNDAEFGRSQNEYTNPYHLDLMNEDWHAYNDNFGTNEEKLFILLMKSMIDDLRKKWSDVYILRNEGAFKIYDFNTGMAFEPDYVLLANDKKEFSVSWQIFIEPKGNHLLEKDAWKEKFLSDITDKTRLICENNNVRIVGLPFYNHATEKQDGIVRKTLNSL